MELVTFAVGAETLRGHLHLPSGAGPFPGIVLTGPFTGVKEQVTGTYAAELAKLGFACLAFDHRNFGESDGMVRQHEEAQKKLDDLVAATSFLTRHKGVDPDRIGTLGICLGGSYALRHAGTDPRIKAFAGVGGAYLDARPADREAAAAKAKWLAGFAEELGAFAEGNPTVLKAVSENPDEPAGMPGQEPFDYYGTDRSASPHWRNAITRLSSYNLGLFDAVVGADLMTDTPGLIVHGTNDLFCSPENAERLARRMAGSSKMEWIETTNHIELYDSAPHVRAAVDHVADWMREHL